MRNILSLDPGTKHLGYVVYTVPTRDILQWGVFSMPTVSSSFLPAIKRFEEHCITQPYDDVVIERQLHSKNVQTSRLEATLEGYFGAGTARVHIMPASKKLTEHGLHITADTLSKVTAREAAAMARHKKACPSSSHSVSKQQRTRLNKSLAIDLCHTFLQHNKQSATVHRQFNGAVKKDDLADALLQALTYVNTCMQ